MSAIVKVSPNETRLRRGWERMSEELKWRERTCEACKEPVGEDMDSFTFCRDGESPPCMLYHGACWDEIAQPLLLTELNKSHTKLTELRAEIKRLSAPQQQITRDGINEIIDSLKAGWRKSGRAESTIQSWVLCCYHLRDAILATAPATEEK